ncbi:MAG: hypothetical protein H7833_05650 [Magnetococcus sp. DMHC-1]|nr:hypothetical protein [Magnetococcales bacterium]
MGEEVEVRDLVMTAVTNALRMKGRRTDDLSGASVLIGTDAIIDSISMVTLIVEIEESVANRFGKEVILAGDGEIFGAESPFRTLDLLVAHVLRLLAED